MFISGLWGELLMLLLLRLLFLFPDDDDASLRVAGNRRMDLSFAVDSEDLDLLRKLVGFDKPSEAMAFEISEPSSSPSE